jgi:hypothetical protein
VSDGSGWFLLFNSGASDMINYYPKASGYSLRCIKDCYTAPGPPAIGYPVPDQTQIIWNWGAVAGATGYKWNTANDYATATDLGMVTTTTESGLTCNTSYKRYFWAYNGCGNSTSIWLFMTTQACFTCGSFTINHVAGSVAPVSKTVNYYTATNMPGEPSKCWITSNLGSYRQARGVDDATEASAGWYWQFNRKQGFKYEGTTRTPNAAWINPVSENMDWEAGNDPCTLELGSGWRIPTASEWTNVDAAGGWTDWTGPWNSALKLHGAGNLYFTDGILNVRGGRGFYWSSSQSSLDLSHNLGFDNGACGMGLGPNFKANGFTVRCIK